MKYDLYVITDVARAGGLTHAEIAERAIAGGADVVQLRDKMCGARELCHIGPGYPCDCREKPEHCS